MTVGEVAKARNIDPDDVFFDIAVEDELQVKYVVPRANTDCAALADALRDTRTMIGLSDTGARTWICCASQAIRRIYRDIGCAKKRRSAWSRRSNALPPNPRISSGSRTAAGCKQAPLPIS